MDTLVDWVLEYPDIDLCGHEALLQAVPLEEVIQLIFECAFKHDDDLYWNYIHHIVAERRPILELSEFLDQLECLCEKIRDSLDYVLDNDQLVEFLEEYPIAHCSLNPRSNTLLLRFSHERPLWTTP